MDKKQLKHMPESSALTLGRTANPVKKKRQTVTTTLVWYVVPPRFPRKDNRGKVGY
jgi:hypothetical protein